MLNRARAAWLDNRRRRRAAGFRGRAGASSSRTRAASCWSPGAWGGSDHPTGRPRMKQRATRALDARMSRSLSVCQFNCQSAAELEGSPTDNVACNSRRSLKELCLTFSRSNILCLQGLRVPVAGDAPSREMIITTDTGKRKLLLWGTRPKSSHGSDAHVGVAIGLSGALLHAQVTRMDPPRELQGWIGGART